MGLARTLLVTCLLFGCSHTMSPYGGVDLDDPDGTDQPIDTGQANLPPVANAGPHQAAEVGDVVQLDGSGSYDPDGDELTFEWTMLERPSGSTTTLINDRRVDPQFWADVAGTYTIELLVSDGHLTDVDETQVVVTNPNGAPTANAGPDQTVTVGSIVQLNGSASWDPDGDPLTFQWAFLSKPSGSVAVLDNPTNPLPRFTADRVGTYQIELVVHDGTSPSAPDTVRVYAQAENDDDGGCFSCAGAERQLTAGDLASGPGLLLLPLALLVWRRRRNEA